MSEADQELLTELGAVREQLAALTGDLRGMRSWLARVDGEVGGMREWLEATSQQASRLQDQVGRRVPEAVALDPSGALERFDAGLGGTVDGFRGGGQDEGDSLYLAFEDIFRGSEEVIRERQEAYLPLLRDGVPVLDAGCGRGELLELLAEHGLEGGGIDIDPAMIKHCRLKGLDNVQVAEAVGYLETKRAASLGTVFAAQVIEHLPFAELLRFLRAARMALAPGGRLIVETVNPHAPQGMKHFWLDPTHQHPLFPEAVLVFCRLTGFASGFIWYPQGSGDPDRDRLEQLDYAVIAERGPV